MKKDEIKMKRIKNILFIVYLLALLWIMASVIDIVWDNCLPNPTHCWWNFFVIVFR